MTETLSRNRLAGSQRRLSLRESSGPFLNVGSAKTATFGEKGDVP